MIMNKKLLEYEPRRIEHVFHCGTAVVITHTVEACFSVQNEQKFDAFVGWKTFQHVPSTIDPPRTKASVFIKVS